MLLICHAVIKNSYNIEILKTGQTEGRYRPGTTDTLLLLWGMQVNAIGSETCLAMSTKAEGEIYGHKSSS